MKTFIRLSLLISFVVCFITSSYAQTQWYWTNTGGDNAWSNSDNWDDGYGGTGSPAAGDDIIFDGDISTGNCNLDVTTFNTPTSRINSITFYNGFSNSFNQNIVFYVLTVTLSAGTFAQGAALYVGDQTLVDGTLTIDGGTFSGATQAIYINGTFTISSGTFNATTGTTRFIRDFSVSGGTFDAGTGTCLFTTMSSSVLSLTIAGTVDFYKLTLSAANILNNTDNYTFVISNTITANNTLMLATGLSAGSRSISINTGTINVEAGLTISNTSTSTNGGGNGTLNFNGTIDQTLTGPITDGQKKLPGIKIDKSSGTLTISNYITTAGNWEYASGTIDFGTSTVTFAGSSSQTIKGAQNTSFYNLTKNTSQILTIGDASTSGNTIQATNAFTWTDNNDKITVGNGQNVTFKVPGAITINGGQTLESTSNGTFDCNGTWTNDGTFTHGNGTVIMRGTAASITGSASVNSFYNLTLNHSSAGTVTIPSQKAVTVTNTLTLTSANSSLLVDGSASGTSVYSGSLITGSISNTGGACKFKTGILKEKWHCISSPVSTASIPSVFDDLATHNDNLYWYNETVADGYWTQITSGNMGVAKGYYIYYFNNKFKTYTGGTFNTGTQGPALSYTTSGRDGWNFIGNPYPSAIDWKASSGWTKTNLNDAIYVRNGSTWASYVGGVGTNGGTRYVQPGQGFFVVANASSPVISMTNDVRVHNTASSLLKEATQDLLARINISWEDSLFSDAVVRFNENATTSFDPNYDAYKFFSENSNMPEVYTLANEDSMSINSFPIFIQDFVIPLGVKTGLAGEYTISTNEIENLPTNAQVLLEDILLDSIIVMTTENSYIFTTIQNDINTTGRFNLRFNIVNPPEISVQPTSQTVCSNEAVSLSVDVAYPNSETYQWYNSEGILDGAIQNTYTISSATSADQDSYYCVVTNDDGSVQSDAAVLTVNNSVAVSNQPAGISICENENYSLSVNADGTGIAYQWYKDNTLLTGETSSSVSLNIISSEEAGTYYCEITGVCNTINTDNAVVAVKPLPIVDLGTNQTVCEGTPVTLDAGNTGAEFLWSTEETTQTISLATSGTYIVVVSKDNCTTTAQVDVTINPLPIVDLGNDNTLCETSSVVLQAGNPGATYEWSTGTTGSQITVTTTGTYSVTVTKDACSATDEVSYVFNPFPVVNLGANQAICNGTTLTLDAGNTGASYIWSNNANAQTLDVTTAGTYEVTVTVDGCSAIDAITITTKPTPYVDLGSDSEVCQGTYVSLDAGFVTGNTYLWSTGSQNQILNPTQTGIYSVTVTRDGCSGEGTVGIVFNAIPTVDLGQNITACDNENISLYAGISGAQYLWSSNETTQTIVPLYTGSYSVTVTQNGCSNYDAVYVQIKSTPYVELGSDIETCEGLPVALDAGYINGNSYTWSSGSHYQTISVSESGTYSVTVTNNGCSSTDEIGVTINLLPVVDLGTSIELCAGCSTIFDAGNSGSIYAWSTSETTQTISVSEAGTYTVTVTSPEGCSTIESVVVDISTGNNSLTLSEQIDIFPNPVINVLNVHTNYTGFYKIVLSDIQGKVKMSINTDKNHSVLDMNSIENGVYLLQIISAEKTTIEKIIKH